MGVWRKVPSTFISCLLSKYKVGEEEPTPEIALWFQLQPLNSVRPILQRISGTKFWTFHKLKLPKEVRLTPFRRPPLLSDVDIAQSQVNRPRRFKLYCLTLLFLRCLVRISPGIPAICIKAYRGFPRCLWEDGQYNNSEGHTIASFYVQLNPLFPILLYKVSAYDSVVK
jgi:hypothetical protein